MISPSGGAGELVWAAYTPPLSLHCPRPRPRPRPLPLPCGDIVVDSDGQEAARRSMCM